MESFQRRLTHDAEPDESFDLPNDSDSYNGIVEAIAQSLQSDMMDDWEKTP